MPVRADSQEQNVLRVVADEDRSSGVHSGSVMAGLAFFHGSGLFLGCRLG
jgi:hypothetical protein